MEQSILVSRMEGRHLKVSGITSVIDFHAWYYSVVWEICTITWCLWTPRIVNVQLRIILAPNIRYFGDAKSKHKQADLSPIRVKGLGAEWEPKFYKAVRLSFLFFWEHRTIPSSLLGSEFWWWGRQEGSSQVVGWKGKGQLVQIALPDFLFLMWQVGGKNMERWIWITLYNDGPDSKPPEVTANTQMCYNGIFRLTQFSMLYFSTASWATSLLHLQSQGCHHLGSHNAYVATTGLSKELLLS